MKKEEAIEQFDLAIKNYENTLRLDCVDEQSKGVIRQAIELYSTALSALRPVSREQVEKVWRGEWEPGNPICPICGKNKFDGLDADIWADWMPSFCPNCGAPMTDKAVQMVMERMETIR